MDDVSNNANGNPDENSNVVSSDGKQVSPDSAAPPVANGQTNRRSAIETFLRGLEYVNHLTVSDEVQVRASDKATSYALLILSLVTVVSLVYPIMEPHRLPLLLACDVLVGAVIFFYIVNRFGILTTLQSRQALLCWQLMQGSMFFGIFLTINLALLVGLIVGSTHMDIQVPPPN